MESKKGITLLTLIITIAVMITLVTVIVGTSLSDTLTQADFTKIVTEMTEVHNAIMQRDTENILNQELYPYVGKDLTAEPMQVNGVVYGEGYYYLETENDKTALGLERVSKNYIINYQTGEVISTEVISYKGQEYYTLSDMENAEK